MCLLSPILVSPYTKKEKDVGNLSDLQRSLHINILWLYNFPLRIFCLLGIMRTQGEICGGLEFVIVVVRCSWSNINKTSSYLVFSLCKQNSCISQDEYWEHSPAIQVFPLAPCQRNRNWLTSSEWKEGEQEAIYVRESFNLYKASSDPVIILFPGSYHFLILTDVVFRSFLEKLTGFAKKALKG